MIKSSELLEHLKTEMVKHFHENGLNYTTNFHEEMSYNSYANVDVIMKVLSGTITNNRIVYPVQIIVDIENEYFEEVKEALNSFAIYNNETLFQIEGKPELAIKQFYSTPIVLSLFEQNGSNLTTSLTINATYIVFEGAIFSNDTYIKIDNTILEGVTGINYNNIHSCDSTVKNGDPVARNYVNAIQITLSVDVDFIRNNELHQKLMEEKNSNKSYAIKYYNGFVEETHNMTIVNITENVLIGGIMQGRISFAIVG